MKKISLYTILLCLCFSATAQITVPNSTLPDVGDVLSLTRFDYELESSSFKMQGENLSWSYDEFVVTGPAVEEFLDITGTELADSFPQANMIVELSGFQAAAVRDDNTIEVVGLGALDFMDIAIDGGIDFDDSYTLRKTPISYGDFYEDNFDVVVQIAAEEVPFLDTIEIPIPGATLDSIRLNIVNYKAEEATAWGTLDLLGESYEVLKVEQLDTSALVVEAGVTVFGSFLWVDASEFLDGLIPSIPNRVTHKFLDENSKSPIVEFTDVSFVDPQTGESIERVTGRMSAEILSSSPEIQVASNDILVYPNPTSDLLRFEFDDQLGEIEKISIFNLNGQRVFSTNNFNGKLSVKDIPEGHYFIKIHTEESIYLKRLQVVSSK